MMLIFQDFYTDVRTTETRRIVAVMSTSKSLLNFMNDQSKLTEHVKNQMTQKLAGLTISLMAVSIGLYTH